MLQTLKVQPVLAYDFYKRREATSWRPWGGILTEQDLAQEKERIGGELKALSAAMKLPLEVRPLATARTADEAAALAKGSHDVTLLYGAGGNQKVLETLLSPSHWNLLFLRHRSGPAYLWYEIADPRLLRKTVDQRTQPGLGVQDVVVDSQAEVVLRLRGLYGLKNTLGKRIVAVGGASGWGAGGRQAPQISRDLWKMEIVDVPYKDLGERIKRARSSDALVKRCAAEADRYLKQRGVTLDTQRSFVPKSFLLTEVFRDLLDEYKTDAITINQCMGTIMGMSETTACLPLSLLNDDGYMAFCESDFVVIPSGVLLRYISNKPVFLNDPTHPHDGLVTMAHCTAPRRNDGQNMDPARILTHFESDYGASPKVEFRKGTPMTVIDPDFASQRWLGFLSEVVDNPFLHICRSQVDVAIKGNTDKLVEEMRGFHWMACHGNYLKETGYALRKAGVDWLVV
ncbi:MAG: sugar isomerase [Acidobacteria bacterium]|nr:sugar isomerase [Acidobacteriota bacterium]